MNESIEMHSQTGNGEPVETKAIQLEAPELLYSLDPRFVDNERFGGLILIAVALLSASIGLLLTWLFRGADWLLVGLSAVTLFIVLMLAYSTLIWPRIYYRHASWRLDGESLEIRRGVFWKQRISVPLGRVQHADVSQGPFQRRFGIGKLTVHTAGTSNASVELDGLEYSQAIRIRDQLVRQTRSVTSAGDMS